MMKENWYALCLCILGNKTPDQALRKFHIIQYKEKTNKRKKLDITIGKNIN